MINHVHKTPPDGSLVWVRVYDESAEPPLLPYWERMSDAELAAWRATAQAARDTLRQAHSSAQSAENDADALRRADAVSVVATLEANVNTDPANLTQASAQLRWIKRILLFLLKRELR